MTDVKLCINCKHFNPVKGQPVNMGQCWHPKNVKSRYDINPVDGSPYDPPKVKMTIDYAEIIRTSESAERCGYVGSWYEPTTLKTLVEGAGND